MTKKPSKRKARGLTIEERIYYFRIVTRMLPEFKKYQCWQDARVGLGFLEYDLRKKQATKRKVKSKGKV